MSDELRKYHAQVRKVTAAGGTIHQKLDPGLVPEGGWKAGIPPAKTFIDEETGEEKEVRRGGENGHGTVSDSSAMTPALEQHIIELFGEGIPAFEIEKKFDLAKGYVRYALVRRFGSVEAYKTALKKLLLENAVATSQHTLANIEALHPSQSGMLAATMTNAFIALDKHDKDTPRQIDFGALASFGETLERIEKYAGIAVSVDNSDDLDESANESQTSSSSPDDE